VLDSALLLEGKGMKNKSLLWKQLPPTAFALFTLLIAIATTIGWPGQRLARAAQRSAAPTVSGYIPGSKEQRMAQLATLQQQRQRQLRERKKAASQQNANAGGPQQAIASFLGNATTILAPGASSMVLARQPDCSLALSALNYTLGANWSATLTGVASHYEQTLHNEASLQTQADVFANGCMEQTLGIGSRIVVYAGKSTQGLYVYGGTHHNIPASANNVLSVAVNSDFTLNSYSADPSIVNAGSVATGDLNGDGNGDIIAVNSYAQSGGSVSVLLGNSNGTFQPAVSYSTAGNKALAAVVDDVNGDGKLDVVVASDTQQISVLAGKGDGTFNPAQSFAVTYPTYQGVVLPVDDLITADLRGIGRKDIIASNGIVLLNNGDGTFSATPNPAFPAAGAGYLAAGDVNKDGHTDLVVGENGSTISIYLGKGDGTFTPGNSYASIDNQGYVTVTDLDGDGNPDIYTGIANGGLFGGDDFDLNLAYALMGNGDGTFQGAISLPVSYNGTNLGDINGDGKPDLISNNSTSFTPYLANGNGNFTAGTPLQVPTSFTLGGHSYTETAAGSFFALADVNGDSKADLIFTAGAGGLFQYSNEPIYFVALSNGNGTFAAPVPAAMSLVAAGDHDYENTLYGLQTADFNGDGHTDLIFTYTGQSYDGTYSQGFAILLGNGDGTFKAPILQTSYSSTTAPAYYLGPQIAAIGDVNNDHKPDLMVIAETSSPTTQLQPNTQMELLLGNGDGTFGKPSVISTATNPVLPIDAPTPAVLADLNGDGRLDLICLGDTPAGQGQLAISLGNGDGTFGTPSILNTTDGGGNIISQDGLAVADFDGDGKLDVAVASFDSSASGIYFGNGDGTITSFNSSAPVDVFNLAVFGSSVAADFNGDGKADLLVASTVLINSYGASPPPLTTTTTSLTASAASITTGSSVTLTATITGASGSTAVPTGTVTFLDGTATLGTGTLNGSAAATYSTNKLATGAHSITAQYGGDSNFAASTSTAVTVTVQAAVPASFTVSASPTSLSITAGASGTTTVSVTPAGGFAQAVSFACSDVPSEATCTFAPATVTPGASAVTTTLTITTTAPQPAVEKSRIYGSGMTGLLALGSLLLFATTGIGRADRWGRWFVLAIALTLGGGLISCGGGSSGGGGTTTTNSGTPAGASTITLTATAGSISKTTTLQVTVQ
jgi:hypothetical protein